MAKVATAKINTNQPTLAVRAAHMFDNTKDSVLLDISKPIEKSRTKQGAVVLSLVGIGVAIGSTL